MYRHVGLVMANVRDLQGNTHRRYLSQIRLVLPGNSSEEIYPVVSESSFAPAPDPTHHGEGIAENGTVLLIVEDSGFLPAHSDLQQVTLPTQRPERSRKLPKCYSPYGGRVLDRINNFKWLHCKVVIRNLPLLFLCL